jgi:small subunit ribosomal protein S8
MAAVSDPIADMLTRIRNGIHARHARVDMPSSKLKVAIAGILKEEGYINNFKISDEGKKKTLRVFLRYGPDGDSVLTTMERVSRPGRRVYVEKDRIPRVLGGMGISVLTTPKGVMTGRTARKSGIGGEVLCTIS